MPPADPSLSLTRLLDPAVLADPYPLYRRLREEAPVHWDPFLHAWVVTRYADVVTVLHGFSAARAPGPQQFAALGLPGLAPIAAVMVRQMLFLDPPAHTRLRRLCGAAFTTARIEHLRGHIEAIANRLLDRVLPAGHMDVIADFAAPLPAIVTAELMGLPAEDHGLLKQWSADFSEMLGNFQHNPDRYRRVLASLEDMTTYFRAAIERLARVPGQGLLQAMLASGQDGARLTEDEIIANAIVTMVGGQETTTNLIGNGLLALLHRPDKLAELRDRSELLESGVEELLRFVSPSQHTARLVPEDTGLGGMTLRKRQAVIAVMAAANRDPERFTAPEALDLHRADNRHLAFGWAAHFCFGAPLARLEGQIAFAALLRRLRDPALEPQPLAWRSNLGLRGLQALPVRFSPA